MLVATWKAGEGKLGSFRKNRKKGCASAMRMNCDWFRFAKIEKGGSASIMRDWVCFAKMDKKMLMGMRTNDAHNYAHEL